MTFRIAHISDSHLSRSKTYFLANFDGVAARVRASRPDLVINTGDISLDGAGEQDDFVFAKQKHDALGVPWRTIPGNHDVGDNIPYSKAQPVTEERRQRFVAVYGPDWWTFDVPGWRVLGVDSLIMGSGLAAEDAQWDFIAAAARQAGSRALMLCIHKPPFVDGPQETAVGPEYLDPAPRHRLLAALAPARLALIACGHVHETRDRTHGGVRHIWAPPSSFIVPSPPSPLHGKQVTGFAEHALEADGTFVSRIVEMPELPLLSIGDYPQTYAHLRPFHNQTAKTDADR